MSTGDALLRYGKGIRGAGLAVLVAAVVLLGVWLSTGHGAPGPSGSTTPTPTSPASPVSPPGSTSSGGGTSSGGTSSSGGAASGGDATSGGGNGDGGNGDGGNGDGGNGDGGNGNGDGGSGGDTSVILTGVATLITAVGGVATTGFGQFLVWKQMQQAREDRRRETRDAGTQGPGTPDADPA